MSQLTGIQTGTFQSDLFIGEIDIVNLTEETADAGILKATINALGGDDNIRGRSTLVAATTAALTSTGIAASDIDAGSGNDAVTGPGLADGFVSTEFDAGGGRLMGYGISGGSASGLSGNDTFTFTGTGNLGNDVTGIGASSVMLNGNTGSDIFIISGVAKGGEKGSSKGLEGAELRGGSGEDQIDIKATTQTGRAFGSSVFAAVGVDQSQVIGNGNRDTINITADGRGTDGTVLGTSQSQVSGGTDDDTITVSAKGFGSGRSSGTSTVVGIDSNSVVGGGSGSDVLTFEAQASGGGRSGGGGTAYGIRDSRVAGGSGNDQIVVRASGDGLSFGTSYAAFNARINGGTGNDDIQLSATASSLSGGRASGAADSKIRGGAGDDRITITAKDFSRATEPRAAVSGSEISGGVGSDIITIEALGAGGAGTSVGVAYEIQDTLVFGGAGDDTFDIGIGTGTIRAGAGNDTAVLDYFNAETMEIRAIASGIQITGVQTNLGTEGAWTQDIIGVERYIIGANTYDDQTISQLLS